MNPHHKDFILLLADNSMILGQRLGELCGHGPVLEQDIAITNIALDLIGESRNYYHYLAEVEGRHEDDYPMLRTERQFKNILLVEQKNGHWGDTLMRQFMYDCYHYFMLEGLTRSKDERLAAIAAKSIKEASYHLSFSSEWIKRLGDGTKESHEKVQDSLNNLMPYFHEMFMAEDFEIYAAEQGFSPDHDTVRHHAVHKFEEVISLAGLKIPEVPYPRTGGKKGLHTENLGFILAELQYMQRTYPGVTW
jgi:ring-1,2-phenylacetyl-CoA epoxidase subunit PaaC